MHIFLVLVVLYKRISFYLSGHKRAQAFSVQDFLCFELGPSGSGLWLMICSQDES